MSGRIPAADSAGGCNGELTRISAAIGAGRWRAVGEVRRWRGTAPRLDRPRKIPARMAGPCRARQPSRASANRRRPGHQPAAGPTSCSVVTAAEASAALGGQKVTGPHTGHATVEGGTACVWYGPHVPSGASPNIPYGGTVRVVLVTGPKAKKHFDDYRSKVQAQTIAGLGDAAF